MFVTFSCILLFNAKLCFRYGLSFSENKSLAVDKFQLW